MVGDSITGCLNQPLWAAAPSEEAEAEVQEEATSLLLTKGGGCLVFFVFCSNLDFVCASTKISSGLVFSSFILISEWLFLSCWCSVRLFMSSRTTTRPGYAWQACFKHWGWASVSDQCRCLGPIFPFPPFFPTPLFLSSPQSEWFHQPCQLLIQRWAVLNQFGPQSSEENQARASLKEKLVFFNELNKEVQSTNPSWQSANHPAGNWS